MKKFCYPLFLLFLMALCFSMNLSCSNKVSLGIPSQPSIINGSFEDDSSTAWNNIFLKKYEEFTVESEGINGSRCASLKLSKKHKNDNIGQSIELKTSIQHIVVECWVKIDGQAKALLHVECLNPAIQKLNGHEIYGQLRVRSSEPIMTSGQWIRVEVEVDVPSKTTEIQIFGVANWVNGNATVCFDDFIITKVE